MSLVICSRAEVMADDVPLYGWGHEDKGVLASFAFKGDLDNMKQHITRKNVNERGIRGYSPLMWSVTRGKIEAVELLLNSGANVNHTDDVGTTPLHIASWHGRKPIVQALIDKGANVNAYTLRRDGDRNYHTPLHFACRGTVQANTVIRLLINSGADLRARNGKGYTPLHLANNPKKVEILLKSGADVNAPDLVGNSLLHTVASHEIIRLLLEFGADVDMKNGRGRTALDTLTNPDDIKLLLEYGAGSRVICNKWACGCGKTVLMCLYGSSIWGVSPKILWDDGSVEEIEHHIIRTKVCGLYLGKNNDPSVNPHPFIDYPASQREEYRRLCEAEFALMSDEIPNMTRKITYKDVLYQRPFALSERSMKKVLTLEHCEEKFFEYGGFIYARFILGLRRLNLVNRCLNFFNLATPPLPLPHFIRDVCAYLGDKDLQELGIVCAAAKKRAIHQKSSKGGTSASQGSNVSAKKRPIGGTSTKGGNSAKQDSKVSLKKLPICETSSKGGTSAQQGSNVSTKKRPIRGTSSEGSTSSAQKASNVSTKETSGTSQQRQRSDCSESAEKGRFSGYEPRSTRSKRCCSDNNQPGPSSGFSQQNMKRSKRYK